jgi:hypothetical protein
VSTASKKDDLVAFRLTVAEHRDLLRAAMREHRHKSDLVREGVRRVVSEILAGSPNAEEESHERAQ